MSIHRTAHVINENHRLSFLPALVGPHYLTFEQLVYNEAEIQIQGYDKGYWEFVRAQLEGDDLDLTTGYMRWDSPTGKVTVSNSGNYFKGVVSDDAAGIIVSLVALNRLCWMTKDDKVINEFYKLILSL